MNNVSELRFSKGNKEELLPDFSDDFPYISTCAELDKYPERFVPWHWHKAVEIFYMKSGTLEYCTPKGKLVFPTGSGGFINSNVLHMTRAISQNEKNIQFLHIFTPSFIAGSQGSRIEKKYVIPITAAPQIEMIPFYPDIPSQAKILEIIKETFCFSEDDICYEIKIREALSKIWIMLYEEVHSCLDKNMKLDKNDERLKMMMIYIHEHYADKITISELASTVYISERECFRIFRNYLHITPTEYIRAYRLQEACQMLAGSQESITDIARACGLGNSSYFGKIFREYTNCTPKEYRRKWQDNTNNCPK